MFEDEQQVHYWIFKIIQVVKWKSVSKHDATEVKKDYNSNLCDILFGFGICHN